MVVAETSKEAYQYAKDIGSVMANQIMIYQCLESDGAHTDLEISRITGLPINVVTPRRNELLALNKIEYCGRKVSELNGVKIGRSGKVWKIKEDK